MNTSHVNRVHYNGLDSLRGIAIIMVAIYHCFDYVAAFKFGWLGVDLFFVLSGFLITDLLVLTKNHTHFLKLFYIRRALRILPLYYVSVLSFLVLGSMLFDEQGINSTFGYYVNNQTWFWLHIQNWLFVLEGRAPMPYLSHFWSLAVEEQFYIFWPLLILLIKSISNLKKVTIVLIIVAIIVRCTIYFQENTWVEQYYENTLARMDSLLIGSLLAIVKHENKNLSFSLFKWLGICTAVLVTTSIIWERNIFQDSFINATIGYTIYDLIFAGLIYAFIYCKHSIINKISDSKILGYLGKISYGIYVFHLPAYLIISTKSSNIINLLSFNEFHLKIFISLMSIGATIIISIISFHLIEMPILRLKQKFEYD